MKNKIYLVVTILFASCSLLTAFLFAPVTREAQAAVDIPTLKTPYGYIIDTTPIFKWTKVTSATNYQLQVFQGTTLLYTKTYDNSFCGTTTCQRSPSDVLALGKYKWRMRAKIGVSWKAWSSYKLFNLIEPSLSFNSNFNGSMSGWMKKAGGAWGVSTTALHTAGLLNNWTSIYRTTGNYDNFSLEASVKRTVSANQMSYICIRMGNNLDTDKDWYPGYKFGYSNDGHFSVWREDSPSVEVPIYNYVVTSHVLPYDWNNLKVTTNGSNFAFYINGNKVGLFTDTSYTTGQVGFMIYKNVASEDELLVDWARLEVIHDP